MRTNLSKHNFGRTVGCTVLSNPEDWLPPGNPEVVSHHGFSSKFGSDEILVASWPGCTLDDDRLRRLAEALRQATSINAELMMQQGKLGCIAPGAHADLLVVDGDPLTDISLLAADGKNRRTIVKGGEVVKDELR